MFSTDLRRTAAALLGINGVLHLVLSPEYLGQKTYVGLLFLAGGLVATTAAIRLWRSDDRMAWRLGIVTAAGMAIGLVLSRTTSLPSFKEAEWELSAVVSLLTEVGFLALAWNGLPRIGRSRGSASTA